MALTIWIREVVKQWLLSRNAIVSRPPGQFDVTEHRLRKARDRGLAISYAVDGGAHVGEWSRMLTRIFPGARVMMVEPRADVQARLSAVAADVPGGIRVETLLGASHRTVDFHQSDTQSSVLPDHMGHGFGTTERKTMTTIDALVEEYQWPQVDLIKLDLQGYELQALSGAQTTLPSCQAIVLEVSFVPFQQGMPLAIEAFDFLRDAGFTIYDILALTHRPLDGRMGQADVLFLRNDHELLRDARWSSGEE